MPNGLFGNMDPRTQGLMAAAFQGLAASGPQPRPTSLGQIIGQMGEAGLGQFNRSATVQQEMAIRALHADIQKQNMEINRRRMEQAIEAAKAEKVEKDRNSDLMRSMREKIRPGMSSTEIQMAILPELFEIDPLKAAKTLGDIEIKKSQLDAKVADLEKRLEDKNLDRESRERIAREANATRIEAANITSARQGGDKPLTGNELLKFVDNEGNHPPAGMTMSQLVSSGKYRVASTQQINQLAGAQGAQQMLSQLEGFVNTLWPDKEETGLDARMRAATRVGVGGYTQSNPEAARFLSFKAGTMAPFIRALGEKGTLAEGDVKRAINLLPKETDSGAVAHGKMRDLKQLLEESVKIKERTGQTSTSFANEAEAARAAAEGRIKPGDKIIVNGVTGTWQ